MRHFLSGVASAPWFFASGLTPKNQGAGATLLRSLIYDRAVQREILKVDAQFFDLAVEARQAELQSFGGFTFFRPLP